jgi:hypothetical protein
MPGQSPVRLVGDPGTPPHGRVRSAYVQMLGRYVWSGGKRLASLDAAVSFVLVAKLAEPRDHRWQLNARRDHDDQIDDRLCGQMRDGRAADVFDALREWAKGTGNAAPAGLESCGCTNACDRSPHADTLWVKAREWVVPEPSIGSVEGTQLW